jgi:hypothetical protein
MTIFRPEPRVRVTDQCRIEIYRPITRGESFSRRRLPAYPIGRRGAQPTPPVCSTNDWAADDTIHLPTEKMVEPLSQENDSVLIKVKTKSARGAYAGCSYRRNL